MTCIGVQGRARLAGWVLLAAATILSGCIHIFHEVHVTQLDVRNPVAVRSPVRVHLKDGSVVVYASGVTASSTMLRGTGTRYDVLRQPLATMQVVALDSVVALETYTTSLNTGNSMGMSTLMTGLAIGAMIAGACALNSNEPGCGLTGWNLRPVPARQLGVVRGPSR
jgi:hypothetical protein